MRFPQFLTENAAINHEMANSDVSAIRRSVSFPSKMPARRVIRFANGEIYFWAGSINTTAVSTSLWASARSDCNEVTFRRWCELVAPEGRSIAHVYADGGAIRRAPAMQHAR